MNLNELAGYELVSVLYKSSPWTKLYIHKIGKDRFEIEDSSTNQKTTVSMPFRQLVDMLKGKGFKETIYEDISDEDVATLNIPLLLRLLEFAREDAKTDMDLHHLVERIVEKSKETGVLSMDVYNYLVSNDVLSSSSKKVEEASIKALSAVEKKMHPDIKVGMRVVVKDPSISYKVEFGQLLRFGESGLAHLQMNNGDRVAVPPSWLFPDVATALPYEKTQKRTCSNRENSH